MHTIYIYICFFHVIIISNPLTTTFGSDITMNSLLAITWDKKTYRTAITKHKKPESRYESLDSYLVLPMHQTNFEYDLRGILFKIYFNRKSYSPIIRFGETVKSLSLVESFFSSFVQTIFILTGNQHCRVIYFINFNAN